MALINPVHGLVVPFLCIFTIPLAIFAGITTTLAFTILMFRVAVVYIDIGLGLIPQYFTWRTKPQILPERHDKQRLSRDGLKTPISPSGSGSRSGASTPPPLSPHSQTPTFLPSGYKSPGSRRRKSSYGFGAAFKHSRRSSQVSLASLGMITPIHGEGEIAPVTETGLTPSVGLDRDFEGVGGWRLDDCDDDGNWTNINSRLELPVERASFHRHQRSQSLGPVPPSDSAWVNPRYRTEWSPEGKDWERNRSGSGAKSPGRTRRLNQRIQLPSAMTALDKENSYFPDLVSPMSTRNRFTP